MNAAVRVRQLVVVGLAAALTVGVAPAEAQQASAVLAVRSDGQLFVIRSGRKHPISAVTVPDEVLNALPTGEAVSLAQLLDGARASAPAPVPKTISFGTPLRSQEGGEPGATGGSRNGPWEYTITRAERLDHLNGRVPKGYYVAVYATVTSFSRTSGVAGDGREVRIRDTAGRFHPPLYDVLYDARRPLGLPLPYDPIWPDQPFDTVWVYDLPPDATGLVLVLPLGAELELGLG